MSTGAVCILHSLAMKKNGRIAPAAQATSPSAAIALARTVLPSLQSAG